jgi:hypothetical protein
MKLDNATAAAHFPEEMMSWICFEQWLKRR